MPFGPMLRARTIRDLPRLMVLAVAAIAGCGQRGPLTLPPSAERPSAERAVPQPGTGSDDEAETRRRDQRRR
jgi:predicted small lipoprotein YifL